MNVQTYDASARASLPKVAGLYVAHDDTLAFYIGQTINLRLRWREHHRQRYLPGAFRITTITDVPCGAEWLWVAETALIHRFAPPLNGVHMHYTCTYTGVLKAKDAEALIASARQTSPLWNAELALAIVRDTLRRAQLFLASIPPAVAGGDASHVATDEQPRRLSQRHPQPTPQPEAV